MIRDISDIYHIVFRCGDRRYALATLGIAKSSALVVEVVIFAWSINRIISKKDQSQSRNRSLRRISVLKSDASTSITIPCPLRRGVEDRDS